MRILYIQYNNPGALPPLMHSAHLLARRGSKILVLGLKGKSGAGTFDFGYHPAISVRAMRECQPGWKQKTHFLLFCAWSFWTALVWRPDWTYVSDILACPVGSLLAQVSKTIYHEHDFPLGGRNNAGPVSLFMRLAQWARTRLARNCSCCIVPNTARAKLLRESTQTSRRIITVWNTPGRDEAAQPTDIVRSDKAFILFYHGTIVPARLPPTLLEALTRTPSHVALHVVGYETIGHPGYSQHLRGIADRLGLGTRVRFFGAMSRRDASLAEARKANVGISLMPMSPSDSNQLSMAGASNKPFDYMACGLALLVTDLPDWNEMYVRSGFAKVCNPADPESIAVAIEWFVEHRNETSEMGEKGRQKILSVWNYETQFEPALRLMMPESTRI